VEDADWGNLRFGLEQREHEGAFVPRMVRFGRRTMEQNSNADDQNIQES